VLHQPLRPVGREPLLERPQVLGERRRRGREAREHEARGDADRQRPQAVGVLVEAGEAGLLGDGQQASVEAVRPAVVGAAHRLAAVAVAVEDAGGAVTAHVREGAELAVLAADDGDRLAGDRHREVVAGLAQLARVAHQEPVAGEDLAPLGLVQLRAAVCPRRQGARGDLGAHAALPRARGTGPSSCAVAAASAVRIPAGVRSPISVSRPQSSTQAASRRAAPSTSTSARIDPSATPSAISWATWSSHSWCDSATITRASSLWAAYCHISFQTAQFVRIAGSSPAQVRISRSTRSRPFASWARCSSATASARSSACANAPTITWAREGK